ncbi:MAG TPA: hypothetical protein VGD07_03170 [Methylomirabilota bacterium]
MAPARPEPCPCFRLTVTVHQHSAIFRGGGSGFWHGHTSLTATLADTSDQDVYRFRADDHDEQWNVSGYGSGTKAAQQSLRDALRKLVRQMALRELPAAAGEATR